MMRSLFIVMIRGASLQLSPTVIWLFAFEGVGVVGGVGRVVTG